MRIGFLLGYAASTLVPVPKSVLSIMAGLIWGFWVAVGGLGVLTVGGAVVGVRARRRSVTTITPKTRDEHV